MGGVPPQGPPPGPPILPSGYRFKEDGLVSGGRGLKKLKHRKRMLQQHLLSQTRPQHPEKEQFAPLQQDPPLTPREQFAKFYGFALPPPLPQQEHSDVGYPYECGGGLIATNNLCSCTPPPAQFRRLSSSRASSSAPTYPSTLSHDDLLAIFNGQLVYSKTKLSTPTKREWSILPPRAEGKFVPDLKLKARCQGLSSASIESTPFTRSPSIKRLSRIQDSDKQGVLTLLTLGQPSFKSTRCYSLYPYPC